MSRKGKFSIDPFFKRGVRGRSVCKHTPGETPVACGRLRTLPQTAKAPYGRRSARGEFRNSPVDCFWRGAAVPTGTLLLQERASPLRRYINLSAFQNGTQKESDIFSKENPSLAGIFLFQNSPPDYFEIHLFRSARCVFVGRCPTPRKPFEKGLTENFYFLDMNLIVCALQEIYLFTSV